MPEGSYRHAMAKVMGNFLEWVEDESERLHQGLEPANFVTRNGDPIFPDDPEELWWLTDVQQQQV